MWELKEGDCLSVLKQMESESVDALVTDPPAGISFMGRAWDSDKGGRDEWIAWLAKVMRECLRVMKPGAHGLVWAIPRTSHWTAMALEQAGFEVRDSVLHVFGQGFPKSLDVYKAAIKNGIACACETGPKAKTKTDLSGVQSAIYAEVQPSVEQGQALQQSVLRDLALSESQDPGAHGVHVQARSGNRKSTPQPNQESAPYGAQSGLEGRGDLQAEQGKLCRPEVRPVPTGVPADGSQGRLCDGTSAGYGDALGSVSHAHGSSASQGPQHAEQSHFQSGMVPGQSRPQACRSCGKPRIQSGLGTALKPAVELWWLIRKPISEKNVAANVLKHGTGAINIDGTRVEAADQHVLDAAVKRMTGNVVQQENATGNFVSGSKTIQPKSAQGRFPSNLILGCACESETHEAECAVRLLDEQSGVLKSGGGDKGKRTPDSGGASRFFYVAKVSPSERNAGLDEMPDKELATSTGQTRPGAPARLGSNPDGRQIVKNHHPTVKPLKLMRYLCRMVTPPNGLVLDPFCGSGSTGVAAIHERFRFVGIEQDADYAMIARMRLKHASELKQAMQMPLIPEATPCP